MTFIHYKSTFIAINGIEPLKNSMQLKILCRTHVAMYCSVIDHRWLQNVEKPKKGDMQGAAKCVSHGLTTFQHFLQPITEQSHTNMESINVIK